MKWLTNCQQLVSIEPGPSGSQCNDVSENHANLIDLRAGQTSHNLVARSVTLSLKITQTCIDMRADQTSHILVARSVTENQYVSLKIMQTCTSTVCGADPRLALLFSPAVFVVSMRVDDKNSLKQKSNQTEFQMLDSRSNREKPYRFFPLDMLGSSVTHKGYAETFGRPTVCN